MATNFTTSSTSELPPTTTPAVTSTSQANDYSPTSSGAEAPGQTGSQTKLQTQVRDTECLACRITGSGILSGTGAYAVWQSRAAAPGTPMQKRIVAGLGIGLMIGSVFRWRSWK